MKCGLRVAALATLSLPLLVAACAKGADGTTPAAGSSAGSGSSAVPSTSVRPPAPGPSYPDVTKGDSSTAAMLYSFDATVHSAVIEPVIYMEGPTYCKKYRIRQSDARCSLEIITVQSHQKAAVPVSPDAKLFAAESGNRDCSGSVEEGGSCSVTTAQFTTLVDQNKGGFVVHMTIVDGTATRIAEEYQP
jgi:hypothetical protein